jgi:hypothetical protein
MGYMQLVCLLASYMFGEMTVTILPMYSSKRRLLHEIIKNRWRRTKSTESPIRKGDVVQYTKSPISKHRWLRGVYEDVTYFEIKNVTYWYSFKKCMRYSYVFSIPSICSWWIYPFHMWTVSSRFPKLFIVIKITNYTNRLSLKSE